MAVPIVHEDSSMKAGFANHGRLAIAVDAGRVSGVGDYEKNLCERLGDWLLIASVGFVSRLKRFFSDPQVLTVLLTLTALFVITLVFYPIRTSAWLIDALDWTISQIKLFASKLRFILYILSVSQIVGFGVRALGRFGNRSLMDQWYERLRTINVDA